MRFAEYTTADGRTIATVIIEIANKLYNKLLFSDENGAYYYHSSEPSNNKKYLTAAEYNELMNHIHV